MTDSAGFDHDFLSGYLDGELTVEERVEVEAQLAASPELRAELEEVTVARAAVRGLPQRDAPSGFWDAVLANVEAAAVDETGGDESRRLWRSSPVATGTCARAGSRAPRRSRPRSSP